MRDELTTKTIALFRALHPKEYNSEDKELRQKAYGDFYEEIFETGLN